MADNAETVMTQLVICTWGW